MEEQEEIVEPKSKTASRHLELSSALAPEAEAIPLDDLELPVYMRSLTGLGEFDRVLGGGLVHGSVVLLSGEPGIGKSTLLLQICGELGKSKKVLYISGEESQGQLKLRAKRLHIGGAGLFLCIATNIHSILAQIDKLRPDIVILDSIQSMYHPEINSMPGSVTQVKETALALIRKAKI